jgi:hypothetical protein
MKRGSLLRAFSRERGLRRNHLKTFPFRTRHTVKPGNFRVSMAGTCSLLPSLSC